MNRFRLVIEASPISSIGSRSKRSGLLAQCVGYVAMMLLASLYFGSTAVAADAQPLTKIVTASVSECRLGQTVQVPMITWGGDEATIYANGGKARTAAGSLFAKRGLDFQLVREDIFSNQVEAYLTCRSPYLRGTMGMINMAAEVASQDPRTEIVPIYQMTWSAGGDALVVRDGIKNVASLKNKRIAVQAYGPHVDYLTKVLNDAGLSTNDVKLVWTKDLVGFDGDTPVTALYNNKVDAAFVIIPDALALTSNGQVGTGTEDSVKGARILMSTKTANRIISDVYAVRADYLKTNRVDVQNFVHGLLQAEEALANIVKNKRGTKKADYRTIMAQSADLLLGSPQAVPDAEGMYLDAEFVGWRGNIKFFGDENYPRNFDNLTDEIQSSFTRLGLLNKKVALNHARWDYNVFKTGLNNTAGVEAPRFDESKVAQVVSRLQQQDALASGELFRFEVYFKPNQQQFTAAQYQSEFKRVINLASTYGGAVITVEGHTDPLGYLKAVKAGESSMVLKRQKQANRNLSLSRANQVRDEIVAYAQSRGVTLDGSQFAAIGHGFMKPANGKLCGEDPCAPATKQEWLNNMRVEFRIIQVEAEATEFEAL